MPLAELLRDRAQNALSNPSLVKEEDIQSAVFEAKEIVGSKDIKAPVLVDLAFYRLKVRFGAEPTESEELMYKEALRIVRDTPLLEGLPEGRVKARVATRRNRWA